MPTDAGRLLTKSKNPKHQEAVAAAQSQIRATG